MTTSTSAASATTRRGRPGYDQQAVLRAAVEVFNRHGYDSTSMGMLASELGLTKSAIYHHVESKQELLSLALDEALTALEEVLDQSAARGGEPMDRLERGIRATVLVLTDKLPFVTLLLRLRGNSPVEVAALERRRIFDQRMVERIVAAREAGGLRADIDPATSARLIFGTINSIVEWWQPGGRLSPDELADDVVKMVFQGLAAGPGHPGVR